MVIETLAQLAFDSGAERISIEIDAADGGNTSAVIVSRFGQAGLTEGKEARLLSVLAQPLVVSGNVGEIDNKVVSLVDELRNPIVEAGKELPETDAVKRRSALKNASKGSEGVDTEDGETPVDESVDTNALASGEAESL
ncbi:MAG: hypothetical protein GKR90_25550 [Pseudomonadales bacterium]|nr:hypothetical protein [Pseudomonadales bacterium]